MHAYILVIQKFVEIIILSFVTTSKVIVCLSELGFCYEYNIPNYLVTLPQLRPLLM